MPSIEQRRSALRERIPRWTPRTLDEWLDHCAATWPERELVVTDRRTLTYAEVAEESRRLADGMAALGVRPGDRVGLLVANYAEFVTCRFAVARAGAVAVPLNFLYRTKELAFVLARSRCRLLVTMTGHAGLNQQEMLDELVPGWDGPGFADRPPEAGDQLPHLRQVVLLPTDDQPRRGVPTGADLDDLGSRNPGAARAEHRPDDVGDILFTSGSTGNAKGVQVTHDAVLRTAYASALTRAYEDGRRILFSLPCYHMFGYVEGLLSAMYVGGAVIMQTAFSAEGYLTGIEKYRATDILCVPTMAVALVESTQRHARDLSSLTAVLCGSAPAPVWLWEQVEQDLGVSEIVTGYGMTECGGCMTLTLPEDDLALTSTTVGRPKIAGAAGTDGGDALCVYRTVDPITGKAVADGAVGELVSTGPTAMLGYVDDPDETAQTLRDGWIYSGDLGRVRADGYLELTGRSKELYKSGGELVMPKEVEDVLAAHEGVSQVYAVGLQDDRWGEIGCAVVVPVPGSDLSEDDVLAYAREHLARFKVPKRVVLFDAADLPTTPTGKVQKFRLVEMLTTRRTEGSPS